MNIQSVYILFWIYSILGWIMETCVVSIENKRFINRGFFLGPYCPIYGTGGVLLLTLSKYQKEPLVVFLLSIIICSIVEYLTSYFLELIYRIRWWDYSNRMFNINGRICLFNAICFGLLGMLMVCFLNPYFINLINNLNNNIILTIILILLTVTTTDMIITFGAMFDIRNTIVNLKDKTLNNLFKPNTDNTEEISNKIKNIIKDKSFIHKHITKAYSNFKIYKNQFLEKTEELTKHRIKETKENYYILIGIMSIILGLIIGYFINNISLMIPLFLGIGLIIAFYTKRGKNGK